MNVTLGLLTLGAFPAGLLALQALDDLFPTISRVTGRLFPTRTDPHPTDPNPRNLPR